MKFSSSFSKLHLNYFFNCSIGTRNYKFNTHTNQVQKDKESRRLLYIHCRHLKKQFDKSLILSTFLFEPHCTLARKVNKCVLRKGQKKKINYKNIKKSSENSVCSDWGPCTHETQSETVSLEPGYMLIRFVGWEKHGTTSPRVGSCNM